MEIINNPYLNRTMIRDVEEFYGRRREVARIYSRIGTTHPQSVSIVGPRRIGKSSLLYFIYQPENREKYLRNSELYKFVFIDFQERRNITLPEFFNALYGQLSQQFQGRLELPETPGYEGLKEIVTGIQQQGLKLIMLFDEFDSITRNPNFDMEFFAFLRALANRYDVAYVVSSGRHLQELCHDKEIADSPFFNIFSNLFLSPFDRETALTLIREPSEIAGYPLESVANTIISMAGYFPFFIQIACSEFLEYALDESVKPGDIPLTEIHERYMQEAGDHFEYVWDHFPEDHQQVLLLLARGEHPPASSQYLLRELQRQGYVVAEQGQLHLFSSLFGEYIQELGLSESSLEAAELSIRMERIEQELHEAEVMQRSILPSEDPDFSGLDISSYFQPATEIGGDYYDYIPITETTLAIAVGDVKGHGMQAGLLVSAASGCLHTSLETTQSIAEIMQVVNRRVCEVKGNTLMTLCFSTLDTTSSLLSFSSAGHFFPYHYCAGTRSLMPWELEGSLPLGVLQDIDYPVCSRTLSRDDILVYYSDGLVEGDNPDEEMFGFERLEASILRHADLNASDMKQAILADFLAHCGQHEQEDDVTLIVVKIS